MGIKNHPILKQLVISVLAAMSVFFSNSILALAAEDTQSADVIQPAEITSVPPVAATSDQAATDNTVTASDPASDAVADTAATDAATDEKSAAAEKSLAVTETPDPQANEPGKQVGKKLQLSTDPLTGSLVYAYGLTIPTGRNGLQPDLQLTYTSQSDDDASVFGYGWSINIPYIERLNKHGVDKLYTDNIFNSSSVI